MADEDQPPEHIWLNTEALNQHFERVRQRYKSGSSASEPIEQADLDTNDLTAALMKGR